MNVKPSDYSLPSRPDKTLQWLEKSRDSWKEKIKVTKDDLKKKKLAVKRARIGRDQLDEELSKEKAAHYRAQEQLSQKDSEIAELKTQLAKVTQQVEDLKKKKSLR